MNDQKNIQDLRPNEIFKGFTLLKTVQKCTAANNKPYLKCRLADATGELDGKAWDYNGPISSDDAGKVAYVECRTEEYNGTVQANIQVIRLAGSTDDVDLTRLVPKAPLDPIAGMESIRKAINSIADPDYRSVCEAILKRHEEEFQSAPAALLMHHAFLHGLQMHTANMLRLAKICSRIYPDVLDADLLLAGTLLHDIGKLREFLISENGLVSDYSKDGQLLGHLVLGVMEIEEISKELDIPHEKALLLEHLIASHHGKPEFGAAVMPKCPEAELLPYLDMIDSRLEMYREEFKDIEPGVFSAHKVFGLDNKKILRVK